MIQKYKRSKALSLRSEIISIDDFTDNKICFDKDLNSDSESDDAEESLDSEDEAEIEQQKALDKLREEKEMRRKFNDKIRRENEKPLVEKAQDFVNLFTLPAGK